MSRPRKKGRGLRDPWSPEQWLDHLATGSSGFGGLIQARLAHGLGCSGLERFPFLTFVPSCELSRERWEVYREEIMQEFTRRHPGKRPWAAIQFD